MIKIQRIIFLRKKKVECQSSMKKIVLKNAYSKKTKKTDKQQKYVTSYLKKFTFWKKRLAC